MLWKKQTILSVFRTETSNQLKLGKRLRSLSSHAHRVFDSDGFEPSVETRALEKILKDNSVITSGETQQKVEEKESLSDSKVVHPSKLTYTDDKSIPITSVMKFVRPKDDTPQGIWPVYRIMEADGCFRDGTNDGYKISHSTQGTMGRKTDKLATHEIGLGQALDGLRQDLKMEAPLHATVIDQSKLFSPAKHPFFDTNSCDTLFRAYSQMVRLREMDKILQNAQRQGRISFYMTCHGEEAIHIGASSALQLQDVVLAQYREAGVLMWRGFTLDQFMNQCFTNSKDLGKGRQMPVMYGSRALNYQTISPPLGTQIPQAAGVGYNLKLTNKNAVAVCFFGDGCASTTDFHSGLNFASTLKAPVVFFCRNNGYAISTPVSDQYAGDGIVSRAPGYGMAAIRVDGNDVFAVHESVRVAREYAIEHQSPVLVEALTYRQGHHSTSDDSFQYRSTDEVEGFADVHDPIKRLQNFMVRHKQLTFEEFSTIEKEEKKAVIDAMHRAEQIPKPPIGDLFSDVYAEIPKSLQEQKHELVEHLEKHQHKYTLE